VYPLIRQNQQETATAAIPAKTIGDFSRYAPHPISAKPAAQSPRSTHTCSLSAQGSIVSGGGFHRGLSIAPRA